MAAYSFRFSVMNTNILVAKILLIQIPLLQCTVLACIFEIIVHAYLGGVRLFGKFRLMCSNLQVLWVSLLSKQLYFHLKSIYHLSLWSLLYAFFPTFLKHSQFSKKSAPNLGVYADVCLAKILLISTR